jgi:hypothetical protein
LLKLDRLRISPYSGEVRYVMRTIGTVQQGQELRCGSLNGARMSVFFIIPLLLGTCVHTHLARRPHFTDL